MGQAESRQEQFWEACGFGHTERVRLFIEEGIDVNWTSKTVGRTKIKFNKFAWSSATDSNFYCVKIVNMHKVWAT